MTVNRKYQSEEEIYCRKEHARTQKVLDTFFKQNEHRIKKVRKGLGESQTMELRESSSSGSSTLSGED